MPGPAGRGFAGRAGCYTDRVTGSDEPTPQFPAPRGDFEDPAEEPQLLRPPSAEEQAVAARHLAEHGIDFELARDVYLGGPRRDEPLLWEPAKSVFDCQLCETRFATGVITAERVFSAQLWDDSLKPFLVGARSEQERDEITRRYLAGELSAAVLQASRRASRRRPAKDPRPTVDHRRARVQDWILAQYAIEGVLERVIEKALDLQRDEPDKWRAEACDKPRAASTLRRDWQQIPAELIEQAKRAHRERTHRS